MEAMNAEREPDNKKYARLLSRALPTPITTEAEYTRQLEYVEQLMKKGEKDLSPEDERLLGLLTVLIERYEEKHYPVGQVSPLAMLHHLMEVHDLTLKDVWALFSSKGVASEVLNGKRGISITVAKKLGDYFHVSPALFI
jgi:HTH-type transcriptional regulator/antitoxin HigA